MSSAARADAIIESPGRLTCKQRHKSTRMPVDTGRCTIVHYTYGQTVQTKCIHYCHPDERIISSMHVKTRRGGRRRGGGRCKSGGNKKAQEMEAEMGWGGGGGGSRLGGKERRWQWQGKQGEQGQEAVVVKRVVVVVAARSHFCLSGSGPCTAGRACGGKPSYREPPRHCKNSTPIGVGVADAALSAVICCREDICTHLASPVELKAEVRA